jgi:hypothetical protein
MNQRWIKKDTCFEIVVTDKAHVRFHATHENGFNYDQMRSRINRSLHLYTLDQMNVVKVCISLGWNTTEISNVSPERTQR